MSDLLSLPCIATLPKNAEFSNPINEKNYSAAHNSAIGSELTLANPFYSSERAPCPYDESPKAFAGDELARNHA